MTGPSTMDGMSTSKKKKKKHSKSLIKESLCHQFFITPKFGKDRDFIIIHYTGEVHYRLVWAKKVSLAAICLVAGSASFGI